MRSDLWRAVQKADAVDRGNLGSVIPMAEHRKDARPRCSN
jgi:hypothetical protein